MRTIDINGLTNLLNGLNGETKAKITTVTVPGMRKTGNPYTGAITKRTISQVLLNFDYPKEVNRERAKEGKEFDFEAKNRQWGAHLGNSPLITNNGQLYLNCRFKSVESSEFLNNDQPIDKAMIQEWLQESKSSSSAQGLNPENEVIVRTYKLASLREIEVNGEHYVVS